MLCLPPHHFRKLTITSINLRTKSLILNKQHDLRKYVFVLLLLCQSIALDHHQYGARSVIRTNANSYLVDCPTQLICTWIFICCSMTKLKEHSREICYGNSFLHLPGTSKNKLFATNWQSEDIWCKKCCAWLIVFLKT